MKGILRKKEPIIGLDISKEYIRAVELEPVPDGVKINGFGSVQTPQYSIKDGVIVNMSDVSRAISSLMSKCSMSGRKAVASVSSPYGLLRLSRLPYMSKEQIRFALGREVSQYTMFKGADSVFDFHVIEEISEEGIRKMNVLFALTSQDVSDSYMDTAKLAGLDLLSVDLSTMAVLRSMNQTNLKVPGLEVTMVVVINEDSIDMCVLKGESIRFCHTAKVEAMQIVSDPEGFTEKVVSAFKLVLNFYQAKYAGGENISKVIIGCDNYPALPVKERLGQRLREVVIEIGDSASYMLFDEGRIEKTRMGELSSYACALGCALQPAALSGYPVRFNLIPKARAERIELVHFILYANILLVAALVFFLAWSAFLFVSSRGLQEKIVASQACLDNPDPAVARANRLIWEIDKTERTIEQDELFYSAVFLKHVPWDRAVTSVMAKVPDGLWLRRIGNEGDNLVITGSAHSEQPIFTFVRSLERSFYFASAKLLSSQSVKVEGIRRVDFTVACYPGKDKDE